MVLNPKVFSLLIVIATLYCWLMLPLTTYCMLIQRYVDGGGEFSKRWLLSLFVVVPGDGVVMVVVDC